MIIEMIFILKINLKKL